jgi:hypothetical protein
MQISPKKISKNQYNFLKTSFISLEKNGEKKVSTIKQRL